jgi:hypothetical protein
MRTVADRRRIVLMKISDFPLILPVLTGKDLATCDMEDFINGQTEPAEESCTVQYPSSVLTEIVSIPDGLHLVEFPGHYEGADCWCRPEIITIDSVPVINHKDLRKGEFDS